MKKENINRLKKYLFMISIFFSLLLIGHILYVYAFYNSKENPIEWWSVSEWIIWDFPHLNPLKNSTDYNKNIIYLLYRSLLKYDYEKKSIVSDIANCDTTDLSHIECYLNQDINWSNWEKITTDDIIATYNIIKNSDINPLIASLLKKTEIKQEEWKIIFDSKSKDVNFINVLFQPILSKNTIDSIWNKELFWKFNPIDWVYSWPYKIDTVSYDDSLWIQKLILVKNDHYKNWNEKIYILKYMFKFFKDNAHFLKHKETVNIFNDQNNVIWDSIPRLDKNTFFPNQYVSVFVNQDKIKNNDLRTFILEKIDRDNILSKLWNSYKAVYNPYILDKFDTKKDQKNQNIENIMKDLWYLKKDKLSSQILQDENSSIEQAQEQKLNTQLKVVNSPFNKKYFFITNDDLTFSWPVDDLNTEEIYVNDTNIWYKKWDKSFSYNLKLDYKNIVEWENNYKLYFKKWNDKVLVDEFNIIYNKDESKINEIKKDYFTKKSDPKEIQELKNKLKELNNKLMSLDDKSYYDKDYKTFSLNLYYIDNQKDLADVANIIKNMLLTYWIKIETKAISINDLNKKIEQNQKDYDMILIWIDSWIFNFNIFPYFHSSQAKNWYNLSNLKSPSLDEILEKLKWSIQNQETTIELEKKAIEIFKNSQTIKTLYSKENPVLIDKNIKNINFNQNITSYIWVLDILKKANISSEKEIIMKNKNLNDFIDFIKKVFKNDTTLER